MLVGAKFRKAMLRGADFSGCDLRSADFRGADLRGARFGGARMGRSPWVDAMVAMVLLLVAAATSLFASVFLGMFAAYGLDRTINDRAIYQASGTCAVAALSAIALYGYQRKALIACVVAGASASVIVFAASGVSALPLVSGFVKAGSATFAGALAGAVAGAVAGAGSFAGALAIVGAGAGMLVVTFSSAIGDRGLFAGVFRDAFFFGGAAAVAVAGFQLYVIWRVRKKDERFALVTDLRI